MEFEQQLNDAVRDGIREGIMTRLTRDYKNPLDDAIQSAVARLMPEITPLLDEAIRSAIGDESFREEIKQATRKSMAKTLIARFGGELEKRVNDLKSDPTTRARIVMAIDEIVREQCKAF